MVESIRGNIAAMKLYRRFLCVCVFAFAAYPSFSQSPAPDRLQELVIGRDTFFDFGPPFHYLDVYVVRRTDAGSTIERISLTPEANKCYAPAKMQYVEKSSSLSIEEILLGKDPCQIPEKKLRKEAKKQRRGMGFSGANMVLQVKCGTQIRTLRTGVGDKDWFDKKPDTPESTSWTMQLLGNLDKVAGPTVMEKPIFTVDNTVADSPLPSDLLTLQNLSSGKYDQLFPGTTLKASEIYNASLLKPPPPTVQLTDCSPAKPTTFTLPAYPKLPQIANHEGWARIHLIVDLQGNVSGFSVYEGSKLFEGAVRDAVKNWKFPPGYESKEVTVSFDFKLNCKADSSRALP
jgi:TonB family protein